MSRFIPAHVAVLLFFAAATTMSCAAEHLDARDTARSASAPDGATTSVARPTDLRATEKQLGTTAPAPIGDAPPPLPPTDATKHEHALPVYRCPMHPEVQSNAPGTCPKCGMTLQETKSP